MKKLKKNPLTNASNIITYLKNKGLKEINKETYGYFDDIVMEKKYIKLKLTFFNNLIQTDSTLTLIPPYDLGIYGSRYYFEPRTVLLLKKHERKTTAYYNFIINILEDIQEITISELRNKKLRKNPFSNLKASNVIRYFKQIGFEYYNTFDNLLVYTNNDFFVELYKNSENINIEKSSIGWRSEIQYNLKTSPDLIRNHLKCIQDVFLEAIEIMKDIIQ